MNDEQIKFIDRLYKDLYLNDSLKKHSNSKDKYQSIKEYIEYLESIHNKVISHNHIDTLKKMYYDKYVIKEENIPDSYYKHQEEMYLERGYGHVTLNDNEKEELQEQIKNDQKKSLDVWLDYLLSEDSNYIPFWAKYWAFSGMLKLGNFDKETGKYTKRTKHTISKFADLNREALALSIDTLLKYLDKKDINDKELEQLIKTGSFQSIYTYTTNKLLSNSQNIVKRNHGKWIKYNKGRLEDAKKLAESLQGYNTGWCTAGESTAISQVCGGDSYIGGDFYVYYTLDENDEYKVPRIAIRMEGNSIGEIRGVAKDQNLEPEMEEVVKEKIKDFPDKDEYYKKVSDMEMLTKIYKKHNNNEELTKEELTFLYELDDEIEGFGYGEDPRVEEILENRDPHSDIAYLFNIKESQVALDADEMDENTVFLYGDYNVNTESYLKQSLQYVIGNVFVNLKNLDEIVLPKIIKGDLLIRHLKSIKNIKFPEQVSGVLFMPHVECLNEAILPKELGSLWMDSLKSAEGLNLPEKMNGSVVISMLNSSKYLKLPTELDNLELDNLESAEDLILPKRIKGSLILNSLEKIENLEFSNSIGGDLELKSLTHAKNIVFPNYIGRDLSLDRLKKIENVQFPDYIGKDLYLHNLNSVDTLILPNRVEGNIYLDKLSSFKNLVLPSFVGGKLIMKHIEHLPSEIIPNPLTYTIVLANDLEITKENIEEYRKKEKECNYGKEKRRNN